MEKQSIQALVQRVLQEAGPLTLDEVLARVIDVQPIISDNPKRTLRIAITANRRCQAAGDGRYVYLPAFLAGASMRVPMEACVSGQGALVAGSEVETFLWPLGLRLQDRTATIALAEGRVVEVMRAFAVPRPLSPTAIDMPRPFWQWWSGQRARGADTLSLRCEHGETGYYSASGLCTADLDLLAVAARNRRVRDVAAAVLTSSRGLDSDDLTIRLLAHGAYHGEPAPDPLALVLFGSTGPFVPDRTVVTYRPEFTPALWRLFGARIADESALYDAVLADLLGSPAPLQPSAATLPRPLRAVPAATRGIRLKVGLSWMRSVWRLVDMLDDQTFEDLHRAIQDAFSWDNDHLYSFYLSGRAWDRLTEIASPAAAESQEPPYSDEVTLADVDLQPHQRFLYLFDYGDKLRHDLEVVETFPVPASGRFPRIVDRHGEAPPQYPAWDE